METIFHPAWKFLVDRACLHGGVAGTNFGGKVE